MKKKIVIIGILLFASVLFYKKYNSKIGSSISEQAPSKKTTEKELNNEEIININDDRTTYETYIATVEKSELNKKILTTHNPKKFEVGNISGLPRNDSKGIEKLVAGYFENYEESFRQIESLYLKCLGVEKRISSIEERLNNQSKIFEEELNGYYFDKGILETGVCWKFGTKKDPFWLMLKLARRGNEEMQVSLLEYMILAIHRGAINIQKYPDKYFDLRNEAEGFLRNYSHKGVVYATEILYDQYNGMLGKNQLLPTNPVLAYYYAYLADVQNSVEVGYFEKDLSRLYEMLTDMQKTIVDRMTENL